MMKLEEVKAQHPELAMAEGLEMRQGVVYLLRSKEPLTLEARKYIADQFAMKGITMAVADFDFDLFRLTDG